jgi:hypothetical protein
MLIDCSQCESGLIACGDCLVNALVGNGRPEIARKGEDEGNKDIDPGHRRGRRALGAQELRALNVLATAGLVSPLRYRPTPVGEELDAIVAL